MPISPGVTIRTRLAQALSFLPGVTVMNDYVGDPSVEDPQVTIVRDDGQEIFVRDCRGMVMVLC